MCFGFVSESVCMEFTSYTYLHWNFHFFSLVVQEVDINFHIKGQTGALGNVVKTFFETTYHISSNLLTELCEIVSRTI